MSGDVRRKGHEGVEGRLAVIVDDGRTVQQDDVPWIHRGVRTDETIQVRHVAAHGDLVVGNVVAVRGHQLAQVRRARRTCDHEHSRRSAVAAVETSVRLARSRASRSEPSEGWRWVRGAGASRLSGRHGHDPVRPASNGDTESSTSDEPGVELGPRARRWRGASSALLIGGLVLLLWCGVDWLTSTGWIFVAIGP